MERKSKFFMYRDLELRSHTEVVWAAFLDQLKIPYEYEKETYYLPSGIAYLPDFWLPDQQIWIEVKGDAPNDTEVNKAVGLNQLTGYPVYIFRGIPKINVFQSPFDETYISEPSEFTVYRAKFGAEPECLAIRRHSVTQLLERVMHLCH